MATEPAARPALFLATGNAHKVAELAELIAAAGAPWQVRGAAELGGMPDVEENAGTFVGNARLKALALAERVAGRGWTLADDSGLAVEALGGAPGVESAYYAGHPTDNAANRAKLLAALAGVPLAGRGAHFACTLVLLSPAGREWVFTGLCAGHIALGEAGGGGFGYDRLFVPEGYSQTFAELPEAVKQRLSHRARAMAALLAAAPWQ